jgi:hypothetical protein
MSPSPSLLDLSEAIDALATADNVVVELCLISNSTWMVGDLTQIFCALNATDGFLKCDRKMTGCVRFWAKPAELLKQTPNSNSRKLAPARLKIVDWRCCLLRRISPLLALNRRRCFANVRQPIAVIRKLNVVEYVLA